MNVEEVKQLSDVLIPMVAQAIKPDLHRIRDDINAVILSNRASIDKQLESQTVDLMEMIAALSVRVKHLEGLAVKGLVGYGAIVFVATILVNAAAKWVLGP